MFRARRRGSVIILAIAVLALLFIMGSALLIVSSEHRTSARQAAKAGDLRAVHEAVERAALEQLRRDLVGDNTIPYDGN